MILALVMAGVFGVATPDVEPLNAATPEFCWSTSKWIEDDRVKDPAKSPKWIARALAARVIRQTGSSNPGDQPGRARLADKVSGNPRRGAYVEVQFYICDKNGKPNYERNDPDLEYGIELGLEQRPAHPEP